MRRDILICLGLLALNLIAFWPVGQMGFINYDDPAYVFDNPYIRSGINAQSVTWAFTTYYQGNWHPVTWLSHMLDWQWFGLNAAGHHWVNLGLHIASTLLLFLALNQMNTAAGTLGSHAGAGWLTGRSALPVWRSALVAALFAIHPLHIQSVAWISERKDVLSGFFFMLTILCYVKAVTSDGWRVMRNDEPNASHVTRHPSLFYWLALVFFALGLMSKPMLVTLPFVLLLMDFWPLERVTSGGWRVTRFRIPVPQPSTLNHLLFEKWPFFALVLISCILTLAAQGGAGYIIHVAQLPWFARVLLAPVFCVAYLGKIFWPVNLAIFYPYPLVSWWKIICAGLLVLAVSGLCLRQARTRPYGLAGWFWFLVMLVPVIGLVQVGTQSIADRYTYLPSIGLFIVAAWRLGEIAALSPRWRAVAGLVAAAMVLACLADTRHQLRYWRDDATLFGHALEVTPENNSMSYYGLGQIAWRAGDLESAARNYREALKITPGFTDASARLGFILIRQNKPAGAEAEFRKVLKSDPNDTNAHKYLGDALAAQGKLAEAEAEYAAVLKLNPGNTEVSEALQPFIEKLKTAQALTNLYTALQREPTAETHARIAVIQMSQGKIREAVEHYGAALQLKPDAPEILNNLGWMLATFPDDRIRDGAQAVRYAERACELTQHRQPQMLGTLAAAYAEAGRFDDAAAAAQKACDLAAEQGDTLLLQKNQALLEWYRAHKPWRE
jgi:protein O-mannosyl-transferase